MLCGFRVTNKAICYPLLITGYSQTCPESSGHISLIITDYQLLITDYDFIDGSASLTTSFMTLDFITL